jgi:hypothetical protein
MVSSRQCRSHAGRLPDLVTENACCRARIAPSGALGALWRPMQCSTLLSSVVRMVRGQQAAVYAAYVKLGRIGGRLCYWFPPTLKSIKMSPRWFAAGPDRSLVRISFQRLLQQRSA